MTNLQPESDPLGVSRETLADSTLPHSTLISQYFPGQEGAIRAYAQFLTTAGIERGLIGPREGERIWERHIFNCLPITKLLPEGASLFDIGSGAGLPGIVIALARPDLKVTLIEPLERRVEFLNEAVTAIAAGGVEITVIRGRAQDVKKSADFVTARAVAPMEKLKKMTWHMVKTGGSLLAMKGESAAKEMSGIKGAELHEIKLEGIELGRVISVRKGSAITA